MEKKKTSSIRYEKIGFYLIKGQTK